MKAAHKDRIVELVPSGVIFDCTLDRYTSFAIGGPAAAVVRVNRTSDLQPLLTFFREQQLAWRVLGRGTNVLVRDEGFDGVVVLLGDGFRQVCWTTDEHTGKTVVRAGGGLGLGNLSHLCADRGLSGIEFCCGIPGTVGGAVVMNAGAWGGEISQVITEVEVVTADGVVVLGKDDLHFSYRSFPGFSRFQGHGIVSSAVFVLDLGDGEKIRQRCREVMEKRSQLQPTGYPNAGSFFKNPPGESAGKLIDLCGLKGMKLGGAMVSSKHGNFLVNRDHATARDVLSLMRHIQQKVREQHGINLEPEIHIL
ncbi:UDP-N-acetylmuramate dehydrogenase [Desulforhopalus singaporensis]|uniref:UDP-N-acetylenolpyruvoylglucosamine reductase n=1 Tax=Desulforhopalus singaporensis TaxID=91360 RepID=A0A1H0UK08_9BACT|nr:UDP-N-acetylmuramate dehydrogenase [Desulforhopalus singaporensis]SDP66494.1 UDP-N-acetylmuramate dehydrogenase [Desulforhopalus singaporensis]